MISRYKTGFLTYGLETLCYFINHDWIFGELFRFIPFVQQHFVNVLLGYLMSVSLLVGLFFIF